MTDFNFTILTRIYLAALIGSVLAVPAAAFQHPMVLPANLDGTNGYQLVGADGSYTGASTSGIGDFNGDGLDDIAIGASLDAGGGSAYIVYGNEVNETRRNLEQLDGVAGFKLTSASSFLGESVGEAGDFNGDAFADIIVGDPEASKAYIVFGSSMPFSPLIDLEDPSTTIPKVVLVGVSSSSAGLSVSGGGDYNGDGLSDVLVHCPGVNGLAEAYVVFGSISSPPEIDLSILDGINGFVIRCDKGYNLDGGVANAGDINGDGIDDIVWGYPYYSGITGADGQGIADVIFGRKTGFPPLLLVTDLDGTNGFRFYGDNLNDDVGSSVAGAGDINADGYDDLLVGSHYFSNNVSNGFEVGATYVIYGRAVFNLALLPSSALSGTNGYTISGIAANDRIGYSVAGAGDFNADGFLDLLCGGHNNGVFGDYSGQAWMVEGSSFTSALRSLNSIDGSNGFRMDPFQQYDELGYSLAGAGDVNGDGVDDLLVGAPYARPAGTTWPGAAYIVLGNASETTATYYGRTSAGNPPNIPIGGSGTGIPASRAWIDYLDGETSSVETVMVSRSNASIINLDRNQIADVLWKIDTTRTGWTSATVAFQYTTSEVAGFNESDLRVYKAPTPEGPWVELPTVLDLNRNRVKTEVSSMSYFAIAATVARISNWAEFE